MTEPSGPGMDEAIEADLTAELALGLNIDTGDDACRDYISDIVRIVAPIIEREVAAVRADERAKVLAEVEHALSFGLFSRKTPISDAIEAVRALATEATS